MLGRRRGEADSGSVLAVPPGKNKCAEGQGVRIIMIMIVVILVFIL